MRIASPGGASSSDELSNINFIALHISSQQLVQVRDGFNAGADFGKQRTDFIGAVNAAALGHSLGLHPN